MIYDALQLLEEQSYVEKIILKIISTEIYLKQTIQYLSLGNIFTQHETKNK